MKTILKIAVLLVISSMSAAHASNNFQCVNNMYKTQTKLGSDTVEMDFVGEYIKVSHYGHSRNSYEAIYKKGSTATTKFGWWAQLIKVQDFSTWKDMPANLQLAVNVDVSGNITKPPKFVLSGLNNAYLQDETVWFHNIDCK